MKAETSPAPRLEDAPEGVERLAQLVAGRLRVQLRPEQIQQPLPRQPLTRRRQEHEQQRTRRTAGPVAITQGAFANGEADRPEQPGL